MRRKAWPAALLCALCLILTGAVRAPIMPTTDFYVNDAATVLYNGHKKTMMNVSAELEAETGIQLVVLTVSSLGELEAEDYARDVFHGWEIGGREGQNGLLLFYTAERSGCIVYTGSGLDDLLSGEDISGIVSSISQTAANGNASKALLEGTKSAAGRIYTALGREPGPVLAKSLEQAASPQRNIGGPMLVMAVIVLVMGRSMRIAARNRRRLKRGPLHDRRDFTKRVNDEREFETQAKSYGQDQSKEKPEPVVDIYPVEGEIFLEDLAHVPLQYPDAKAPDGEE